MVALPLCPSPSQSAVSENGWVSMLCGVVSTREVIVIAPAFLELWRFGGFMSRGWDPICPVCDRNPPHSTMGLYPPRTVLWSSNQSAISQRDWGFLTVQGSVDPRNLGLLPRLMEVLEMWNHLWTGDGTLYPPEVELAQHANDSQSGNRPVGLGFSITCGEVSCVDGFRSLSCPGDAYFVCESCPMCDQKNLSCFIFV